MAPNSRCLILIWMLSLTTSSVVTPGHTDNSTQVTTVQSVANTTFDQLTSTKATLNKISEFSSPSTTAAITADVNPMDGVTESSTTSMPTTQMRSSEKSLAATNPTNLTLSLISSSPAGMELTSGEAPKAKASVMSTESSNLTILAVTNPTTWNPSPISSSSAGMELTNGAAPKAKASVMSTESSNLTILTVTNPTTSNPSPISSSSAGMEPFKGPTPNAITSVMLTESSILTTMVTRPPMQGSTTQSKEVANTSIVTTDKTTNVSTNQAQTTNLISTAMPSTAVDNKSETTLPGTGGVATTLTSSYRTPTTTARPPIRPTVPKKVQPPPGKKSRDSPVHSKVVAGLIGGSLMLMLLGLLLIYIKKQKLNKKKVTTTEWAGPSPFLEDGVTNGDVTLRSSNRISLSSFLPQRLSKRLSLIQESNEELQEIVPGTFGGKGERELDNNVSENNGTTQFVQEQTRLADAPETNGKSVSETFQQTNNAEIA